MKGAVFTIFQEMIEEKFGMECWEALLKKSDLPSGGIYTSAEIYDDKEILALVTALSEYSGLPAPDLIEAFGRYLFPVLAHSLPPGMTDYPDLWSLLDGVDSVIHVEVRKLYPDAITPKIVITERVDEDSIKLMYQSPRKMCLLAIGLIHQAAERYSDTVTIKHECCMNEGADHCLLTVQKY